MSAAVSTNPSSVSAKPIVFVTGSNGFIGTNLCKRLVESNKYDIHVLVRSLNSTDPEDPPLPPSIVDKLTPHEGDITNAGSILKIFETIQERCICVIHLAGMIAYAGKFRQKMIKVNVDGTRHILEAMTMYTPKARLVHISSVAAVGANKSPSDPWIKEENPNWDQDQADRVSYLYTKKVSEDLVKSYCDRLDCIILCPSNVYGAGDAVKASRSTQVKAANGKWPIYTNGGVSIVDVDSMVNVMLAAMTQGRRGERYIIAGDNITIQEMLTMYAEEAGHKDKAPWLLLPNFVLFILCYIGEMLGSSSFTLERAEVATLYHWFDASKARTELGLKPKSARECIRDSVSWMKEKGLIQ